MTLWETVSAIRPGTIVSSLLDLVAWHPWQAAGILSLFAVVLYAAVGKRNA